MEDFGNIVYIVAAIAWFAWSSYKKSQEGKKKQTTTSHKEPEGRQAMEEYEEPKSFEDLIMEQFGQKKPEPVKIEVEKHPNEDKFLNTDLTHYHLSKDYKMSQGEKKSYRTQRQASKLVEVEEEDESLMESLLPNGFDLRQAVVLNTILERPYN